MILSANNLFPGIGTIFNVIAILCGGAIGLLFKKWITDSLQKLLLCANGIGVILIGISGALSRMFVINGNRMEVQNSFMMIVSLSLGALLGHLLQIDQRFEKFGLYLKEKSGNQAESQFLNAFLTASFTVCIGAMAIVGAIEDSLNLNPSILFAKALLDFTIIMVLTSSLGKGCMYSAIPVGLLQGSISIFASLLKPIFTTNALLNIGLVGSVLIILVGINLLFSKSIKVANLIPALLIALLWSYWPNVLL